MNKSKTKSGKPAAKNGKTPAKPAPAAKTKPSPAPKKLKAEPPAKTEKVELADAAAQPLVVPGNIVHAFIQADELDLSAIVFRNPEAVESVTIFAINVDVSGQRVKLPGKTLTIVADRFVPARAYLELATNKFFIQFRECPGEVTIKPGKDVVTDLFYSAGSRPRETFHSSESYGRRFEQSQRLSMDFIFERSTGRIFRFEQQSSGQFRKTFWYEIWDSLVAPYLAPVVLEEVAELARPCVLSARIRMMIGSRELRQQAGDFLRWLGESCSRTPASPARNQLGALNSSSVLAVQADRGDNYVPFFSSQVYGDMLANQLAALKSLEDQIGNMMSTKSLYDALVVMNGNIADNAAKMIGFVHAVAQQEGAMTKHYEDVINDGRERQKELEHQIKEGGEKAKEWMNDLQIRLQEFKIAYSRAAFWDILISYFEAAGAVVGAIAVSAATAGAAAGPALAGAAAVAAKTAHSLEKLAKVLEALAKVLEVIKQLAEADPVSTKMPELPDQFPAMPSEAVWGEAQEEFEGKLPTEHAEKERNRVIAAFRNMATWSNAVAGLGVEQAKLLAEEKINASLRQISADQRDRLARIQADQQGIPAQDWGALFAGLEFMERSIQIRLIETFLMMERAYRYQFGTEPVRLDPKKISIFELRQKLDEIGTKLVKAWGASSPVPKEMQNIRVEFKDIPAARFENSGFVECALTTDKYLKKVFNNYAMIRVRDVRIELSTKGAAKSKNNDLRVTTNSDQYIIEWRINGDSFFEVLKGGQQRELTTDPMSGVVRCLRSNNQCVKSTPAKWWDDNTLHISPFTTWHIGLPAYYTETNGGLKLEAEVKKGRKKKLVAAEKIDVALIFDIEAVTVPRAPKRKVKGLKK